MSRIELPFYPWQGYVIATIRHPPSLAEASFGGRSPLSLRKRDFFVPDLRIELRTPSFSAMCSTTELVRLGAQSGSRTHIPKDTILSRACMPIPPSGLIIKRPWRESNPRYWFCRPMPKTTWLHGH